MSATVFRSNNEEILKKSHMTCKMSVKERMFVSGTIIKALNNGSITNVKLIPHAYARSEIRNSSQKNIKDNTEYMEKMNKE